MNLASLRAASLSLLDILLIRNGFSLFSPIYYYRPFSGTLYVSFVNCSLGLWFRPLPRESFRQTTCGPAMPTDRSAPFHYNIDSTASTLEMSIYFGSL